VHLQNAIPFPTIPERPAFVTHPVRYLRFASKINISQSFVSVSVRNLKRQGRNGIVGKRPGAAPSCKWKNALAFMKKRQGIFKF
jgi:hypothetical protein